MAVKLLVLAQAMDWFAAMPRQQRLRSLAPDFAQADLARIGGHRCVHAGYEEGDIRWLHTVHLRQLPADAGQAAISPYGYGGPLCNTEDRRFIERAYGAWTVWARGNRVLGEFCRFHPEAGHHRFWLGDVQPNRQTLSVDLAVEPVESQYNTLARRKLRKVTGVPVRWSRESADWLRYGRFYRAAMAAMGAHANYHFDDVYFASLASIPGTELCICGGEANWLSAGLYLFQHREIGDQGRSGTIEYHLGASSASGHALGTAYLMQHAAALEGGRRGLVSLYLGGGTTPEPGNPLLFYKRAFSRRERVFHVGNAVHHTALYDGYLQSRGYHRGNAPPNLLFD